MLGLTACPQAPPQTAAMRAAPNVSVTADLLQTRNFEIGRQMIGSIILTSDSIAAASDLPAVRLRALEWKLYAIPLVQEAALRDDPYVASVDLGAFSMQQVDYFTTGDGRNAFGAQQPLAVQASKELLEMMAKAVVRSLSTGEVRPGTRDSLAAWAARHPMRGSGMQRESILGSDWHLIGLASSSLVETAGNIDRTIRLLTLRLAFMNEFLSEQIRWNAELMVGRALTAPHGDSLLLQGANLVRTMNALTADMPALIDRQRAAIFAGVDRERLLALADVDRQRVATLSEVRIERQAIEATVAREREAILTAVTAERTATLRSVDSLAQRTIERSQSAARRLVFEALIAGLILVAATVAAAMFLMRRWRMTDPRLLNRG